MKKSAITLIAFTLSFSLQGLAAEGGTAAFSEDRAEIAEGYEPGACDDSFNSWTFSSWDFHGGAPISSPCSMVGTAPPVEIGPRLLGLGRIEKGIELPTGAVWQPALYLFGGLRTGISYQEKPNGTEVSEWATRLDMFFNLQLTATERIVLGLTPLHKGGAFSRYQFEPSFNDGWHDETNLDISHFWIEADFGELFPNVDPGRKGRADWGMSYGRQALRFQDGIMLNDVMDSFGLVRNNLHIGKTSPSARITSIYAWNEIERGDNREDRDAKLFGIFSQTDLPWTTVEADLVYVQSDRVGDGWFLGLGAVATNMGYWYTTIRVNASHAPDEENATISDGTLITAQFTRDIPGGHNVFYLDLFAGIDEYRSAARAPTVGGPLGIIGISYASAGLGTFTPAISNQADDAVGMAAGVQLFGHLGFSNWILELAARTQTRGPSDSQYALSARYQKALGLRWQWQVDGYIADGSNRDSDIGLRTELLLRF